MLYDLFIIFWTFFKIGAFTFGGGYAMIPLIVQEVTAKGWATQGMLIDFIAIAESTPGVFAVNISTFIGFERVGVIGAIVATIGVSLPSFIIILFIAMIFHYFVDNVFVVGFLKGAKPIIVGVILSVAVSFILLNVFKVEEVIHLNQAIFNWKHLTILIVALVMIKLKERIHPIYIVVISGLLGYVFFGLL
jgi:chromate transporter